MVDIDRGGFLSVSQLDPEVLAAEDEPVPDIRRDGGMGLGAKVF
jgi:hypothetical protein